MLGFFLLHVIIESMIIFPDNFLWGAATSGHQVEGNNLNSDWWEWEQSGHGKEPSGEACQHYQLYKEDFDLAKSLSHNAHRFSIEWSRIQPGKNEWDPDALKHYIGVVDYLRSLDIEPIVTLHHFTNPSWWLRSGGWVNRKNEDLFLRYVEKVVTALSDKVKFWVTINEPMVYVYHSYIKGYWPPQEKSFVRGKLALDNMAASHIKAHRLIHSIYGRKKSGPPYVGIAHNMIDFIPCLENFRNNFVVNLRHWLFNLRFLNVLHKRNALDYIGLNYYTRHLIDGNGWSLNGLINALCQNDHDNLQKNSLGWEIYPEGLYNILMGLKRYKLPVYIMENGICTSDDSVRWDFIRDHLKAVSGAINKGVEVKGYIYWSFLDNFEWDKGFQPRFGLVDVDYNTFKRTVRESAKKFAKVCQTNRLE